MADRKRRARRCDRSIRACLPSSVGGNERSSPGCGLGLMRAVHSPGRPHCDKMGSLAGDECLGTRKPSESSLTNLARSLVPLQAVLDDACKRADASYWIWDGVHPTAAGHELIARQWLAVVPEGATAVRDVYNPVNAIARGAIATDFSDGALRDNPEINKHVAGIMALGRVGQLDDVKEASLLCFLDYLS